MTGERDEREPESQRWLIFASVPLPSLSARCSTRPDSSYCVLQPHEENGNRLLSKRRSSNAQGRDMSSIFTVFDSLMLIPSLSSYLRADCGRLVSLYMGFAMVYCR